jgi:hypothetical protein
MLSVMVSDLKRYTTIRTVPFLQTFGYYYHIFMSQGLLGPKKELWDLLQTVEKSANEACDITASVRDLPTVR